MNLTEAYKRLKIGPGGQIVIEGYYNERHRKYHNLDHISYMLSHMSTYEEEETDIVAGILFHDIEYCDLPVPPGFNEAASIAVYAALRTGQGADVRFPVVEMINASAYHLQSQKNLRDNTCSFLDLDLIGMASDADTFRSHNDNIEEELVLIYKGSGATLNEIRKGRLNFLTTLLKRDRLYYGQPDKVEYLARYNLSCEIERLKDQTK